MIQDILRGDKDGFQELFNRYGRLILHHAYSWSGDFSTAEDTLQEVFFQAYAKLAHYRGPGSFKKWLLAICRNHLISQHRKKEVPTTPFEFRDSESILESVQSNGSLESIHERENVSSLLHPLVPSIREVMFLRIVENLPYKDIAEIVGAREDSLRQMVSRGLAQLRKEAKAHDVHQI